MKIDDVDFSAYNDISAYNDSRSRPVVVVIGMYDCTDNVSVNAVHLLPCCAIVTNGETYLTNNLQFY